MEDQNECFVSGYLAIILFVSKFIGLAPLSLVKKGKVWRVSLSPNLYIFGCFFVISTNATIIWAVVIELQHYSPGSYQTVTHRVAWAIEVSMVMLTWTIMVFRSSCHTRCLIASMNQVQKIASKLNIHRWSLQWKKMQIGLCISWVLICKAVFFSGSLYFFTSYRLSQETIWLKVAYIFYYVYYCGIQLGIILFILVVLHVRSSFKAVNNCLKSLLRDMEKRQVHVEKNSLNKPNKAFMKINNYIDALTDPKKIYSDIDINSVSFHETVRSIASAYASACDAVRDVDRSYGLMLMVLLAGFFLYLVTKPYYLITNLVAESWTKDPNQAYLVLKEMLQFFWIVYHLINLMIVIEPCHLTHTEMERTRELVGWLIVHADPMSVDLAVELEQFYKQLALNDVSYKPLHVTMMTRGLVFTILGSITTYLVILVDINN